MKIAVLGEGAWGTAFACVLARQGYEVTLWCYDADVAADIDTKRVNTSYLPGHSIPTSVQVTTSLAVALEGKNYYAVALPVQYLRATCERIARDIHLCGTHLCGTWIFLSKGVEHKTGLLPHEIVRDSCALETFLYGIVVGPTFASHYAAQEPSGFVIASPDYGIATGIKKLLQSPTTVCTLSSDVVGVSWCAALKNVIAIGCGILEGLGYHDNTQALFFVSIFSELEKFIVAQGGTQESCMSLAGLGDSVMSSWGKSSKNRECGGLIGHGLTCDQALAHLNRCVEGVFTIYSVKKLIMGKEKELPLLAYLCGIILESQEPDFLVKILMCQFDKKG